jgi:hypothetical protein
MNDSHREPDHLDHRIDASLRRAFEPPASLDDRAVRARRHVAGRPRVGPWVLMAAAAAGLVLLFRAGGEGPAPEERRQAVASLVDTCSLVGPKLEGSLSAPIRTDAARLYAEMDACQRTSELTSCDESDRLAERLGEIYGESVEFKHRAAAQELRGPFGSDEWPTGTIVTMTEDDHTVVLVADRRDTFDCCVAMDELPEGSGLQVFTWPMGELVFAEITPLNEPRMLTLFQ